MYLRQTFLLKARVSCRFWFCLGTLVMISGVKSDKCILTKLILKISEGGVWRREQIVLLLKHVFLMPGKSSQILVCIILLVLSDHRGSYSYQIFYVPEVWVQGYENISKNRTCSEYRGDNLCETRNLCLQSCKQWSLYITQAALKLNVLLDFFFLRRHTLVMMYWPFFFWVIHYEAFHHKTRFPSLTPSPVLPHFHHLL